MHIIDPFTGTGTFITRADAVGPDHSPRSWPTSTSTPIHANELVLLAYYIAAINIEASYHDLVGGQYAAL